MVRQNAKKKTKSDSAKFSAATSGAACSRQATPAKEVANPPSSTLISNVN
jgi:hypothetical protein